MWNALRATGPAPDRALPMMLYGQFVGSWRGTVVVHESQGRRRESPCEVHFDWVLEGRAVQDVWIAPSRDERKPGEQSRMYGTTLRVYDPEKDLWHITWIDPVRQVCNRMTGRRVGDEIEQEYVEDGARYQWRFTEITPDSFHWIARKSGEDGGEWNLIAEFFLRRAARASAAGPERDAPRDERARRAFDFWVGEWTVSHPVTGEHLGENRIERVLGDRVLAEYWTGGDGIRGKSLNIYDETRGVWHQTWVDETGTLALMRSAADPSTDKHPATPGSILPAREQLADLLAELEQPAAALAEYEASLRSAPAPSTAMTAPRRRPSAPERSKRQRPSTSG